LLVAWSEGDRASLEEVTRLVYEELRVLAHRYMQPWRPGQTLHTTVMRQILVDHAKADLCSDGPPDH
jgi:hypothetical protein